MNELTKKEYVMLEIVKHMLSGQSLVVVESKYGLDIIFDSARYLADKIIEEESDLI